MSKPQKSEFPRPPFWRCKCGACNYDHATRCWACHSDREKAEVKED